eukprot:5966113-Prymnesium_polylepis.1
MIATSGSNIFCAPASRCLRLHWKVSLRTKRPTPHVPLTAPTDGSRPVLRSRALSGLGWTRV